MNKVTATMAFAVFVTVFCMAGLTYPESAGPKELKLKITSSAFNEGGIIPKKYTCDGPNISPPLSWSSVPDGTKTLALICDDPDAPAKRWVHWVIFNIPPAVKELQEDLWPQKAAFDKTRQGINDFSSIGYGGPCPPSGYHRYYFKLYALDVELDLPAATTREKLL